MEADSPASLRPTRWSVIAAALMLLVAVGLIYGQTLRHDFVNIDDGRYVTENAEVRGGLTPAGAAWAFATFHASNWHPLTWLSHMLDWELFADWAGGHHLTASLVHALNALLLWLALHRLTGRVWRGAVVAALFALHPLRVESVAWVAERKDLLAGTFWMLGLLAYAAYARRRGIGRYAVLVAVFALGLTAKPMLVTLPLVLLLLDYWPLGRRDSDRPRSWSRLLIEKTPLLVLSAASSMVTLAAQRSGGAVSTVEAVPLLSRISTALVAYSIYLLKTLWPTGLAVYYPHPALGPADPVRDWGLALLSSVLLLVISLAAWRWRRDRPYLMVGWLWYLVTLVPVIGLVQVGTQAWADRYSYIPTIGLALAACWLLGDALQASRVGLRATVTVVALVLSALTLRSWAQTTVWRDSLTLWDHALRVTGGNGTAHLNYGVALLDARRDVEALEQLELARGLRPRDPRVLYNLGNLHRGRGELSRAEQLYRESLELDPDYPRAWINLGLVLLDRQRGPEALDAFERAAELDPRSSEAQTNRANMLSLLGRAGEAVPLYRAVLESEPEFFPARLGLAGALLATGAADEGLAILRELLEARPESTEARFMLARHLERSGDIEAARAQYREVLRFDPDHAGARKGLGLDS